MQEAESRSPLPHPRGAITWRSVSLGLLATVFICSIAYYNDFAVNNTFFIGNNLPLGLVLMTFLFVVGVNGPLSRWAPRYAFSTGELIVAFSMALVSCTMPSGGLMRWLPHAIIGPWWHGQASKEFRDLLVNLRVPDWLYPDFGSSDRKHMVQQPYRERIHAAVDGDRAATILGLGTCGCHLGHPHVCRVWGGDVPDGDRPPAVGRE